MNLKRLLIWFSTVSTILVIVGLVFAFFGLKILPVDGQTLAKYLYRRRVPRNLKALVMTDTELKLIANAAIIGADAWDMYR